MPRSQSGLKRWKVCTGLYAMFACVQTCPPRLYWHRPLPPELHNPALGCSYDVQYGASFEYDLQNVVR